MRIPEAPHRLERATSVVAITSLVVLMAFRIYAAAFTNIVNSGWDDNEYRNAANAAAARMTMAQAVGDIVLPGERANAAISVLGRSIGYHAWLVLGRTLLPAGDPERVWQMVNVVFFLAQALALYSLGFLGGMPRDLRLVMVFVFMSSPMSFGFNRWVMTENHVATAMLSSALACAWLVFGLRRLRAATALQRMARRITMALLAGYVTGAFSSLREYATPFYLLIAAGAVAALLWERRLLAASAFVLGFAPFVRVLVSSFRVLLPEAARKAGQTAYYHATSEWFPHEVQNFWGPSLTVLGFVAVAMAGTYLGELELHAESHAVEGPCERFRGLDVFWLASIAAAGSATVLVLAVKNRLARNGIIIILPLMLILCLGWHRYRPRLSGHLQRIRIVAIGLIAMSWVVFFDQAFFEFDGGRTWRHHCSHLEYYNHPLRLPALRPGEWRNTCGP
jgi:hypothetical protein